MNCSRRSALHADGIQQIVALTKMRDEAQACWNMAAEQARKANGKLARLQSEDRVRERQLEQSKLEARLAVLRSEQLRHAGGYRRTFAQSKRRPPRSATLDKELGALANSGEDLQKKREAAENRRVEVEEQERDLRADSIAVPLASGARRIPAGRERLGATQRLADAGQGQTCRGGCARIRPATLSATIPRPA